MGDQRNVERARPRTWRQLAGQHGRVDEDDERQWPSWLMILGLFTMLVAFWWVSAAVLVTYWTVGRLFCAFAFTGNLFYGRWTWRTLRMTRGYWFMFNLLFIGPMLFAGFFVVNGLFTRSLGDYVVTDAGRQPVKRLWVEHDGLPPRILDRPGEEVTVAVPADTAGLDIRVLHLEKGALGFAIISWRRPHYVAP